MKSDSYTTTELVSRESRTQFEKRLSLVIYLVHVFGRWMCPQSNASRILVNHYYCFRVEIVFLEFFECLVCACELFIELEANLIFVFDKNNKPFTLYISYLFIFLFFFFSIFLSFCARVLSLLLSLLPTRLALTTSAQYESDRTEMITNWNRRMHNYNL